MSYIMWACGCGQELSEARGIDIHDGTDDSFFEVHHAGWEGAAGEKPGVERHEDVLKRRPRWLRQCDRSKVPQVPAGV